MGKKFSELERAVSLNNGDLAAFAQVDQSSPTGYKSKAAPMSLVSQTILKDTEYASDLQTDDKTVLGAINEVNSRTIAYDVVSGPIANFKTSLELPIKSLGIDVNAVQDLHGYDYPWTAGGGKNLIPFPYESSAGTYNGVTFTVNDDGTIILNGTATATTYFNLVSNDSGVPMTAGDYILHRATSETINGLTITAVKNGNYWNATTNQDIRLNLSEDSSVSWYIRISIGTVLSNVKVYPMFEAGSTATEWTPYENICPIEGWSAITLDVNGNTKVINLGGTYYGGHFTQDKEGHRQFTVTHDYIASYNGETINEPWKSSMDAYSQGTTPTTGAQVVYPLATPYTIDLPDGEPIITLNGTNNIYADSGDTSVEYALTIEEYIDKKIAEVQALILNS